MSSRLYNHLRIHQVFGANTDVGKSVLTAALVRASASQGRRVFYLKPVSTGPIEEADDQYIIRCSRKYANNVQTHCLYRYGEPVSPHLAARMEGGSNDKRTIPSDEEFSEMMTAYLDECSGLNEDRADMYVETAGGVHSPTLSGTTQVDAYRPLRLPTILIGDSRLGGISSTISAYESLVLRGYSIDSILLFRDAYYKNHEYLSPYFSEKHGVSVIAFDHPPDKLSNLSKELLSTEKYYDTIQEDAIAVVRFLDEQHTRRIEELASMPRRSLDSFWWPFVQHGQIKSEKDVTVIDSAHGDFFSIYDSDLSKKTPSSEAQNSPKIPSKSPKSSSSSVLRPQLDSSASWWTQTFGHGHPSLALAAARAAGRYGHVMFPKATHLPALQLAERMISNNGPGSPWASRVFFSDDGSTAMEIALKMALRAYTESCLGDVFLDRNERKKLGILGLKGSYHGDTIGAMDACYAAGDGVYTCEWHESKGYWFDPPSVAVVCGRPIISVPASIANDFESPALGTGIEIEAESFAWIYDVGKRLNTPLAGDYRSYIRKALARLTTNENNCSSGTRLAALVLEPLVMGAGGMIFVDPLFQRILIDVARSAGNPSLAPTPTWRNLPIIFDEVFVGLYRMGLSSCAPILGANPDIAVYAKTLTGGLVPMAVTLASEEIFKAFWREEGKGKALMHGHSYTAHAVGCEVANESLKMMDRITKTGQWEEMRARWDGAFGRQRPPLSLSATPIPAAIPDPTSISITPTPVIPVPGKTLAKSTKKEGFWRPNFESLLLIEKITEGVWKGEDTLVDGGPEKRLSLWLNHMKSVGIGAPAPELNETPVPLINLVTDDKFTPISSQTSLPLIWSFWDPDFVDRVSKLDVVESAMTLGTVLAIKLQDRHRGGYESHFAESTLRSLVRPPSESNRNLTSTGTAEQENFGIHFRTLGDVAYFMTSLNTPQATVRAFENRIYSLLHYRTL